MIALIGLDLNKQQSFDKKLSAIQGSELLSYGENNVELWNR